MPNLLWDFNSSEFRIEGLVSSLQQRHAIEAQKLVSAWSTVEIEQSNGIILRVAGSIQPIPRGAIRDFQLVVPSTYPYDGPKAYAVGWKASGPHRYEDNELCLWQRNQWQKNYTLAYAVGKTFIWIHKHEDYLRSGIWRGKEQRH